MSSGPGDLNMAIVDLLLDCENFGADAYSARQLRHRGGRLFTEDEHRLVGQARGVEVQAVADFSAKAAEAARQQHEDIQALADLVRPYVERFGRQTTYRDVYALMPVDQRDQFADLLDRVEGTGR